MGDSSEEDKGVDLRYVVHVESAGGLVEMKKSSMAAGGLAWTPRECGGAGRMGKGTGCRGVKDTTWGARSQKSCPPAG